MTAGSWRRPMATIVAILTLAACAPGSGGSGPEPDLGEIPLIRDPAEIVLPLDAYRLSFSDYTTVQRGAYILTRECVERFGIEYTLTEDALLGQLPPVGSLNERRYGLFDGSSAAVRGYNAPDASMPDDSGHAWNPSAIEELVVRGGYTGAPPIDAAGNPLPPDGCLGEANRLLDEGVPARPPSLDLGGDLSSEAYQRSEADSRVRAAVDQWSDCMADRGYRYRSIWEPNDRDWPEPPGPEEIAVAVADVACKEQVNLVGIWYAVESAYQQQILDSGTHAESLAEVGAFLAAQKENAARIVAGAR